MALLLASVSGAIAEDRIVVTAARAERLAAEQPVSSARLEAEDLGRLRAEHPAEALNRLPGVGVQRNSGAEHLLAIRSPVLTAGAGAGSVLIAENGVPIRGSGFGNVNALFEAHTETAEAIEVVRGPASAAWGGNALHGVIHVLTPTPTAGRASFGEVSVGSYDRMQARAVLREPSGRGLLALSGQSEDGWRAEAGLDLGKATVRWIADLGAVEADVTATFVDLQQETAGFVTGPDAYRDLTLARGNPNPEAFRDASAARLSARMTGLEAGGWAITATPFARWQEMAFLQHFLPDQSLEENAQVGAGVLSLAERSFGAGSRVQLGFDLDVSRGELSEVQTLPSFGTFPQGVHYDYEVEAVAAAAFAQAELDLSPRLRLLPGLRVEHVRYDYDSATPADTIGRFQRPADRSDDFLGVAPKLGVLWRTGEGSALFGHLARAQRPPQTTDLYRLQSRQTVGDIDPETLDSLEVGWRGPFGRAQVEIAAHAAQKRAVFFRDADGFNVTDGATDHAGIELAFEAPLTETLSLSGAASFARHVYAFDRPVANGSEVITAGDRVDTAPDTLGNLQLLWTPRPDLSAELAWAHVGRYFTDAANSRDYDGHDVLDARFDWAATERFAAFLAIRNLADVRYATRADFGFGEDRYFPGEARAVTVGVRVTGR